MKTLLLNNKSLHLGMMKYHLLNFKGLQKDLNLNLRNLNFKKNNKHNFMMCNLKFLHWNNLEILTFIVNMNFIINFYNTFLIIDYISWLLRLCFCYAFFKLYSWLLYLYNIYLVINKYEPNKISRRCQFIRN